jgi:hypothetical protein
MVLKTLGFYSLLLSVLTNCLFINVLLGNRTIYFVVVNLSIIGLIASILGVVFDKKKLFAIVAIALFLAPHVIIWILNAFRKP